MKMDSATLNVYAKVEPPSFAESDGVLDQLNLSLWIKNSECDGCLPQFLHSIRNYQNNTHLPRVQTDFASTLYVHDGDNVLCNLTKEFREYGDYWLRIEGALDGGGGVAADCTCYSVDDGRNPAIFILYAFLIYLGLGLLLTLATSQHIAALRVRLLDGARDLIRKVSTIDADLGGNGGDGATNTGLLSSTRNAAVSQESVTTDASPSGKKRLRSLDAFRGLSIVIMIFVNYEGGGYWFFKHSAWNGLTVADLVFPWFMFIMGTSLAMGMKSSTFRSTPLWKLFWRVSKRTALLFLLGLTLNSKKGNDLSQLRIPGVLQRFAVTYFIVAMLELVFKSDNEEVTQAWWAPIRDIVDSWAQWFVILAMIALHTALILRLPVPGCPVGYLGPGGLHDEGRYVNCTGGATGYIDQIVFGNDHMYTHPTCVRIYSSHVPFDPEGLLGCLTATFTVFLGLQAGKIVRTYGHYAQRLRRFAAWSAGCGVIAAVLCGGSQNGGWIPVNKNLWSLSFVLALASMAFFLLMAFYYVIDVRGWWSGEPLVFPGMNAIVLFMGHEILEDYFPLKWKSEKNHEMTLFFSCWGATFWTLVAYKLYKKKIFISL